MIARYWYICSIFQGIRMKQIKCLEQMLNNCDKSTEQTQCDIQYELNNLISYWFWELIIIYFVFSGLLVFDKWNKGHLRKIINYSFQFPFFDLNFNIKNSVMIFHYEKNLYYAFSYGLSFCYSETPCSMLYAVCGQDTISWFLSFITNGSQ